MVLQIEKKDLIDAVGVVSRFTQTKNTSLPSLTGILIVAGDGGIKLRATNLETGISLDVPGTIEKEGVVVVPALTLKEICLSLDPKGIITLTKEGDTLSLKSSGSTSSLRTLPYEDFPVLPTISESTLNFTFPVSELHQLTQTVLPYASVSTVRPELASIYFNNSGGTLTLVATDSFRLAEKKVSLSKNTPSFSFLIPAKNLALIIQSLPNEEVKIYIDEHQCVFQFKTGTIISRLTQGNYPDYTQIIPKSFAMEATLLKKDFEYGLKRTSVFSDMFQKVTITTKPKTNEIILSAKNNDVGETEEKLSGSVTGDEITISFNHRYLLAPLAAIQSETITVAISGIGRAAVIRGANDSSFLYLVMPMNQ